MPPRGRAVLPRVRSTRPTRPAPVSRDVPRRDAGVPGISSSGSEPASSESTASRAYREALRVMLPPDARARAAAREPTTGTTGTIAPGSASAQSSRVSPDSEAKFRGDVRPRDTFRGRRRGRTRPKRRPGTCPGPTRPRPPRPLQTSPSRSGEPARDAGSSSALARADAIVRAAAAERVADTPAVDSARRRARSSAICAAEATPSPASLAARSRCSIPFSRWNPPPRVGARQRRAGSRALGTRPAAASATTSRVSSRRRVGSEVRVATEVGRAKICSVQSGSGGGETRDERLATRRRRSTENVSENVSANVEDSLPDRPAPRASGSPGVAPRRRRRHSRREVHHVVLAVDVFVFFSGRFAGASNVGLRPRRIRRGDHLARSPATMAAARARGGDGQTHQSRGTITIRDAVRFRIGRRRRRRRGPRPRTSDSSLVCFFVRFAPRTARATSRISARCVARCWRGVPRRVRPRWCPCRRTCGPSWPSWAGSNPSTTCQPPRKPPRAERVRLRGGARGRRCRERDEGGVEGARARGVRR